MFHVKFGVCWVESWDDVGGGTYGLHPPRETVFSIYDDAVKAASAVGGVVLEGRTEWVEVHHD